MKWRRIKLKKIKIIARTEAGEKAMKDKGTAKQNALNKAAMWSMKQALKIIGYKETITSGDPHTVEVAFTHPGAKAQIPQMMIALENQFKELGAKKDKDYSMEVE